MKKAYLGIDIGSISTKGVIIDKDNNIIASEYLYTESNPINAVKRLISILNKKLNKSVYKVISVGTTGSARKLIGTMLGANVIKNEITAHAIGATSIMPNVRTILEIGGQDSKIILLENGFVIDYAMNTLNPVGTSYDLSLQDKKLGIEVKDFGSVAVNYLNNVGKGKKIEGPIMFQGGVSKNIGVVKAFEELLGEKIYVDKNSEFLGALGVAILAKKSKLENEFKFNVEDISLDTKDFNCYGCSNECEIVCILKNNKMIDYWGNRCERGNMVVRN